MVCRKRPAKAPSTGERVRAKCACGKRAQHKLKKLFYCRGCFLKNRPKAAKAACQKRSDQRRAGSEYSERVRAKCACGKRVQHTFNKESYCSGCFRKHHPEAYKAARCAPQEAALLKNHPEAVKPATEAARKGRPCREGPALQGAARKGRPCSEGRSCYYCFLALPADWAPYACDCGTESHPSSVDMGDRCFGPHTKATCAKCWNRLWEKKCFRCADKLARRDIRYGRLCAS